MAKYNLDKCPRCGKPIPEDARPFRTDIIGSATNGGIGLGYTSQVGRGPMISRTDHLVWKISCSGTPQVPRRHFFEVVLRD